jgi:hypothetical protein
MGGTQSLTRQEGVLVKNLCKKGRVGTPSSHRSRGNALKDWLDWVGLVQNQYLAAGSVTKGMFAQGREDTQPFTWLERVLGKE